MKNINASKPCKLRGMFWLLRAIIFFYILYLLYLGSVAIAVFLSVVFAISLLPLLRKKTCGCVDIICITDLLILLIILFHIIGMVEGLYAYPFFDDFLHILGGAFLGILIYSILFSLNHLRSIYLHPYMITLFTVSLALTFGVLWEFFEYFWDAVITPGSNLPPAQLGLTDTLTDLFWDIVGSLMAITVLSMFSKTKLAVKIMVQPFLKIYSQKE